MSTLAEIEKVDDHDIIFSLLPFITGVFVNGPPPYWKKALTARYIIHNVDWVSMATISTQKGIEGYPFATVKSMSDGPVDNSTGVPYFYMSSIELSQQDINKDNRRMIPVQNGTNEYEFAQDALFAKHPQMKTWPTAHGFFVSKFDIEQIEVLDFFGGISKVSTEDYFNASPSSKVKDNIKFNSVGIVDVIYIEQ
ncbi:hypothetical protein HHI36_017027 [Cryptolaemus montrouzieri]|uniref:CREG-like beta-barrel domain-containing protein n=1 Tax=Cryptolaemus montrouzieri TaxID=559131 RepID=A0ABD2NLE2_9CUCU